MRIASFVAVLVGGRVWIHSLTFSCGVRFFTFMDLGSLSGLFPWRGVVRIVLLSFVALPPWEKLLGNISLQSMGSLFASWRDDKAPGTALAAPSPQCKTDMQYYYLFNVSWHKMSRWVLSLSWVKVCWGGQGPSHTIALEHLFCHGCGGALAGGVGVLSKESQEDSQEVVCGVDWVSTMRATEEPFRWQWEWVWSDCNEFISSELHKFGFSGIHAIDMLLDYILDFSSGTYKILISCVHSKLSATKNGTFIACTVLTVP